VASSRLRVDGLFLMSYPLHPQGRPDKLHADQLFRIVNPVVFLQGSRDRTCDLDVLRRTLTRVGAPSALFVAQEADRNFAVPKKAQRTSEEVRDEIGAALDEWIQKVLGEGA